MRVQLGRSLLIQIAWHGLVAVLLLCLPLLKYGQWWWDLPRRQLLPMIVMLAAYCVSALAVLIFLRDDGWRSILRALGITLSVFCLTLAGLMLLRLEVPRYLLLPSIAAAALFLPLSVSTTLIRRVGVVALGLGAIGIGSMSARAIHASATIEHELSETTLRTAFYAVRLLSHRGLVPAPATRGGGLARIGSDVLLGTGDGHLYALGVGPNDGLRARELATRVPLNREEFAKAFGGSSHAPARSIDYTDSGPPHVQTWRFRVAGVLTQQVGDRVRVFASHHFWHPENQCFTVRVSQTEWPLKDWANAAALAEWRTLFETSPCIPMTGPYRKRGKNPFRGEEVGGRMALLDANTMLLTIGDLGFYGMESIQQFAQDANADYGKTVRIDLRSGAHAIYTLGHRNPQGIYVAPDGRVWETEHGSQGGDEVNLLVEHTNYGWPLVTYGTDYGSFGWQLNPQQGHHEGYAKPAFVYVPSIGISAVTGIQSDRFETWKGNLITGSLATRSLYRLMIEGDRVVLSEPIPMNRRVRDVLELPDGRLLVWSDDAALTMIEPATGTGGAMQFAALCSGCHIVRDGMAHRNGPDLYRIVGRPVARATGFDEYSPALKSAGGEWTPERLDQFLKDPQAFAPGTTMGFAGLSDDAARAALIEYMNTFTESLRNK
jgi:cytochrome c2